jgi:hypothetical protein
MNGEKNENWLKEYEEFLGSDGAEVPAEVTSKVISKLKRLLDPSAWSVFAKLLSIHAVVGFLSLSVCHQFELNPFQTSRSLADWFMTVGGHSVCMIGCGVLFVGLSVLASGYFLSIEETRALRRTGFPQSFALSAVSLGLFATVGAELALTFAALWLLGALIGGFIATEAIWKVKYARIQRMQRI